FFFQAEDGIRDKLVTGVQTCALPICAPTDLDRVLPQADFVAVCCQWTPETTKLFNRERFALMQPGSVIVNVARGEIIDEDALYRSEERRVGEGGRGWWWCRALGVRTA